MNKLLSAFSLAILVAFPVACFGQANYESDPAYLPIDKALDLKAIHPEVNINLPRFLLKDAASDLSDSMGEKKAEFAELIKDIKLIRLVVINATKSNRPALDKAIKKLEGELQGKWTSIISVPEDHVGVYAMGDRAGESVAGIALVVYDHGEAVIGNIVGRVSLGKVIKLASQMDKVPKDLLKKLQGMANQTNSSSAINDNEPKADKPAEAAEPTDKESKSK